MKTYRCKNCGEIVSLIIYTPEDPDNPKEDDIKKGIFRCSKCGDLEYDDVEEIDV